MYSIIEQSYIPNRRLYMLSENELFEYYINKNMTLKDISNISGYAESTIATHLNKYKIKKRDYGLFGSKREKLIDDKLLIKLFDSGKTYKEIGLELGLDRNTVARKLKKINKSRNKIIPIGMKFGGLTVISKPISISGKRLYECKCDCGKIKKCFSTRLLDGRNTSCGCLMLSHLKHEFTDNVDNYNKDNNITNFIMNRIIWNARRRNLDFNLTKEYLQKLFEQQNKRCIYTNIEIKIPFRANTILDYYGLDKISNLASLDRIDSTKGYVVGNVQWVLSEINIMKNDLPNEKFLDLCRKVADKI